MSHATIYKVPESGEVEEFRTFGNALHGAPLLWDYLSQRYLGLDGMPFREPELQPLWNLRYDPRLSRAERVALSATLRYAMVRRTEFEETAAAFDEVATLIEHPGHWPAWAAALREMAQDPSCYAACWNQTSACIDEWKVAETCPACGQDLEDDRGFDISKDKGHWFVFDEL